MGNPQYFVPLLSTLGIVISSTGYKENVFSNKCDNEEDNLDKLLNCDKYDPKIKISN